MSASSVSWRGAYFMSRTKRSYRYYVVASNTEVTMKSSFIALHRIISHRTAVHPVTWMQHIFLWIQFQLIPRSRGHCACTFSAWASPPLVRLLHLIAPIVDCSPTMDDHLQWTLRHKSSAAAATAHLKAWVLCVAFHADGMDTDTRGRS
jgi:hypothetical protein